MDPLSVAASVIAVIGAIHAGSKGLQVIYYNTRNAPKEVDILRHELSSLESSLRQIHGFLQQNLPDSSAAHIETLAECVTRADEQTKEINDLLVSPFIRIRRLSSANQTRFAWMQNKSKIANLRNGLQVVRLDLAIVFSLLTA